MARLGLPAPLLMEVAGHSAARHAAAMLAADGSRRAARECVVCGASHNGGDRLVAARVLAAAECQLLVSLMPG